MFVTHGDILFHGLSPWGNEAALLRAAHTRELEALGNRSDLPSQFLAMRRAALVLEDMGETVHRLRKPGLVRAMAHHLWPPWRPFHILSGWARTPFLAGAFAARHAPQAQVIVIGHTHFSGVWRIGKRVVINTGGFVPFSRPLAVDLEEETLSIREVVAKGEAFQLGREVARHRLEW